MTVRVLGYTMARDEWPLLGLSVTHALKIGVEHVVIVDHASSDSTSAALRSISDTWPDRLTILRLDDAAYFQEATTAVVMEVVSAATYDWVYVFDADEFLLTAPGTSLATELSRIPDGVETVRYQVHQWMTPEDMDETSPAHYGRIVQRTLPNVFIEESPLLLADDIEAGDINFFDVPFPSKIIVRGPLSSAISAGAHALVSGATSAEFTADPDQLRAGHLPLLSRERLLRKGQHGQALIDAGFPQQHGWQNQLIGRLELAGTLETFWQAHSDAVSPLPTRAATPATVVDLSLSEALEAVATEVPLSLDLPLSQSLLPANQQTGIPLHHAIRIQHRLIGLRQQLTDERNQLADQVIQATDERNQLATQLAEVSRGLSSHLQHEVDAVRRSRSYRLGNFLLTPLIAAKRALRKAG